MKKILWIINHMPEELAMYLGQKGPVSGSWLKDLSRMVSEEQKVSLHIICPWKFQINYEIGNIKYYTVQMSWIDRFVKPTKRLKVAIAEIKDSVNPDLIHIHGSEFAYALAFINDKYTPVLLSLQGLISEIANKQKFFGSINNEVYRKFDLISKLRTIIPLYIKYLRNKFRARAEKKILSSSKFVIGRTDWDYAHLISLNKQCTYFHLQEVIRNEFFKRSWSINNEDQITVFCGSGFSSPLKGFHHVLFAIKILESDGIKVKIRVPGKNLIEGKGLYGYNYYLYKLINILQIEERITFLGLLSSQEMAEEFSKANLYIMPSSIENSSNTIGEAMCVGTPIIAAYVGGVPSLLDDKKEALFYEYGDIDVMAFKIREIIKKKEVARLLSANCKKRAIKQYNQSEIKDQLFRIYDRIIVDFYKRK